MEHYTSPSPVAAAVSLFDIQYMYSAVAGVSYSGVPTVIC